MNKYLQVMANIAFCAAMIDSITSAIKQGRVGDSVDIPVQFGDKDGPTFSAGGKRVRVKAASFKVNVL